MSKSTECLKYCKKLDDYLLRNLKDDLEHMTVNKDIYILLPDLRVLKQYVIKELYARVLINNG